MRDRPAQRAPVGKGALYFDGLRDLEIGPTTAADVSVGRTKVFPSDLVEDLAVNLGRWLDDYVPPTVCEAEVVSFVRALQLCGWRVLLPDGETHNLPSAETAPRTESTPPES